MAEFPAVRHRRNFARILGSASAGLALGSALLGGAAEAQEMRAPKGPIEITVGTGAGGAPDVIMRYTAKVLNDSKLVANPLVVQNRTGGSWTVASNWVLGKPGNENVVLCVAGPIFSTPIVQGLPTVYDKVTPIAIFVTGEVVVGVQPDSGINSLKDLFDRAREREKSIKIAGAQVGAVDQIVTALLEKAGNVKFNFIPFDGGGAAQTAFLGKNSDMTVMPLNEAVPLVKAGKVKLLAILSDRRRTDDVFKDVPTAREQGADVVWNQTWGIAGPPGLDPAVVRWWEDRITAMIALPEWQKMVDENWLRTDFVDSAHSGAWLKDYHSKFLNVLQLVGLSKI